MPSKPAVRRLVQVTITGLRPEPHATGTARHRTRRHHRTAPRTARLSRGTIPEVLAYNYEHFGLGHVTLDRPGGPQVGDTAPEFTAVNFTARPGH